MEVSREYLMDEFPYYMGIIKGRGYALPEDMKDWELYDIYESLEEDEKKDYITFIYDGDALTEDFIKQIFDLGLDNEAAAYAIKLFRKEFSQKTVEDFIDFGIDKDSLRIVMEMYDGKLDFPRIVDVANALEDEDIVKRLVDNTDDKADVDEIEDLLSIFDDKIYEELLPHINSLNSTDKKYIISQWG